MPAHEKFRVGEVMSVDAGKGFNITNQHGRPLLSLVYPTAEKAQVAHDLIKAALVEAIAVIAHGS